MAEEKTPLFKPPQSERACTVPEHMLLSTETSTTESPALNSPLCAGTVPNAPHSAPGLKSASEKGREAGGKRGENP